MSVGAGIGGFLGWIATMASVSGTTGIHYKVWTIWSILLVAISGVGIVGGIVLWAMFRRPMQPSTVIHVEPGATFNWHSVSGGASQPASSGPTGPYQPPPPRNQPSLFDQDEGD